MLDIIGIEQLSLYYAGYSEEAEEWKNEVIEKQRITEQILDVTAHQDVGSNYTYHSDSHSDGYSYTDHSQEVPKHSKSNDGGRHVKHSNYYDSNGGSWPNNYSYETPPYHTDENYTAHGNQNSTNHSQSGSSGYRYHANHTDTGFDHTNYIPSIPELYKIDGEVKKSEVLSFNIASYDKNSDGEGSTDDDSITILYTLKVRRVMDLMENDVEEDWTVLLDKSTSSDVDFDMREKPEGIYEVYAQTHNAPKSGKGITKQYNSEVKQAFFTLCNNNIPEITVLNANEFGYYAYGLDGAMSPAKVFKDYVADILYQHGAEDQQKGLFIEFTLTDEDPNEYHEVDVRLELPDKTAIAERVPAVLELDSDGISPKAGDVSGVVFLPLEEMLDKGTIEEARVAFFLTDYTDKAMSVPKSSTVKTKLLDELDNYVYVSLDDNYPEINITSADSSWVTSKLVNITFSDSGLGLLSTYIQRVASGSAIDEAGWLEMSPDEREYAALTIQEQGEWDIYAKAVDRAGNTTTGSSLGFMVSPIELTFTAPSMGFYGYDAIFTAEVYSKVECTKVEFWIQNYTSTVTGTFKGREDDTSTFQWVKRITNAIPEGVHVVFCKVYMADGTTKTVSKPIEILDVVPVTVLSSDIKHTDRWEQNRIAFNTNSVYGTKRDANVFWSGERLCVEVVGFGIDHAVARLKNTSFNATLTSPDFLGDNYGDTVTWSGTIWDASMADKWGNTSPQTFVVEISMWDMAGNETVIEKEIVFDNREPYYRQSQSY